MTPLAHRIARELTLPKRRRTFIDQCRLLEQMGDIHCFEVSEVKEAAVELAIDINRKVIPERLAFLPAPKTWIEWQEDKARVGVLLQQTKFDDQVAFTHFALADANKFGSLAGGLLHLHSGAKPTGATHEIGLRDRANTLKIYAFLALINTPRIVGRVTHLPHAGLQKSLVASRAMTGSFPLKAWTEIKLSILPPEIQPGIRDACLTGERALHFCRAYLRIRLGQLEMVRAHWRGDASIGIKQSRYKVTA